MEISPKAFEDIITFARASSATRVNRSGKIEVVANDAPRFDYDPVSLQLRGLLIEESRTNLLLYSEDFTNAAWTKSSMAVTADAGSSPDGATGADKLVPANGSSLTACSVRGTVTKAATATSYTYSIFASAAEFNRIRVFANDGATTANSASATISLADGSIVTAAAASGTFTNASVAVTPFAGSIYRICLTFTSSTETTLHCRAYVFDSVATTGNGTSGIYVWGADLEEGTYATSYKPTASASFTRAAETAKISANTFSQMYNQAEGTLFAVIRPNAVDPARNARFLEVSGGSTVNRVTLFASTSNRMTAQVRTAGVTRSTLLVSGKFQALTRVRVAAAFKDNDLALSVDGGLVTDTSTFPVATPVSELDIGYAGTVPGETLNGWIEAVQYFPNRLSNAQLQAMTA